MEWGTLFRGKKTAAQWREEREGLQRAALGAESHVAALEGRRKIKLLTASAEEIRALDGEIADANLNAERIAAAIEEVDRKIVEAEKREQDEALAGRIAAAMTARQDLFRAYGELHAAANAITAKIVRILEHSATIRTVNSELKGLGRHDALIEHPVGTMNRVHGTQWHHEDFARLLGGPGVPGVPGAPIAEKHILTVHERETLERLAALPAK